MTPTTRYARCGDLSIAYQVVGEGPRDVIIVPGYIWHIELLWNDPGYQRFMERLARFARVIAYDKRGCGLSDPVATAPSLDDRMDDVLAVLDAVGSDKATVFGISEGGPMGALLAATHPQRIDRLILYGSYLVGTEDVFAMPGGERFRALLDSMWEIIDHRWGQGENIRWAAPSIADNPVSRRFVGMLESAGLSPAMARANLRANVEEIDVRPILPSVRVPALVLHRRDEAFPLEHARYYAEHIPGARLIELDGADHWPFVGDVDAIVDEVEQFVTGSRQAPMADRMLATVLFTDIVGSTKRAAAIGDTAWRELLARHDAIVREQLESHGGREVKHTGDGFFATFDGPARGVRCATDIAARMPDLGIEVRAGLHTGECERAGDQLGGLAVHIGARVCDFADAGEVLVSRTVHDLLLGSDIGLVDRGLHNLKGVPGEWHLFAVSSTVAVPLGDAQVRRLSPRDRAAVAVGRRVPAIGRATNRLVRRRGGGSRD